MWVFEADWADRLSHSPPRIHTMPGHYKAQKQLNQPCWGFTCSFATSISKSAVTEAFFSSLQITLDKYIMKKFLPAAGSFWHCSSRQPSRWRGRAAHPWHNAHLPVTSCQLVKQQDKRKARQREQCTFLPSLQWVESMPPAFCPWK